MHFTLKTESDMNLNEYEFGSSFQFDLFFEHFNLTLRQSEYTFLMSCLDLNILYSDEKMKIKIMKNCIKQILNIY